MDSAERHARAEEGAQGGRRPMTLLLFVLAAWGGGYIIAESKLFQRPRTWAAYIPPFVTVNYQKDDGTEGEMRTTYLRLLLTCAACSGTWIGMAISWFALSPTIAYLHPTV